MNCKERVLKTIRFKNPDVIPVGYHIAPSALLKYGESLVDLCRLYPNDFYDVNQVVKIPERDTQHYRSDGTYYKEVTDEWGCVWVIYQEGISGEVKNNPLDDWSKLKKYRFPRVPNSSVDERREARKNMERAKEQYIGWEGPGPLYEQMQWLRGVENLMLDIAEDKEEVYTLADMLLNQYLIPRIELALEAGADVVGFSDDWGTQQSLLINPGSWRKIFKPRYKRMFDLVHQGGAHTWMHSDGMILEILPELAEIGLEVINPQFSCMDIEKLRQATYQKMCIYTDINRQGLMQFSTPDDVRDNVIKIHEVFTLVEGGLIYGAGIYADMPFENIKALLDAFYEYRTLCR